jgi:hypothetical protein
MQHGVAVADLLLEMMCGNFRRLSANKAIAEEAENAKLLPRENALPKRPHDERETREALPPLGCDGKIHARHNPGRCALEKRKLSGARGDLGNKLDGACVSTNDGYVLAMQVDAVIPSGRMNWGPARRSKPVNLGYCGTCKPPKPAVSTLARMRIPSPAAARHTLSASFQIAS